MTDILSRLESRVSEDEWKRISAYAGISVAELKKKVAEAHQDTDGGVVAAQAATPPKPTVRIGQPVKVGGCTREDFDIGISSLLELKGYVEICFESITNWSGEVHIDVYVAGINVWGTTYKVDPNNLGVCYEFNFALAKGKICIGVVVGDDKICINLNGNICVWDTWHWDWLCWPFDVTPVCIPLP